MKGRLLCRVYSYWQCQRLCFQVTLHPKSAFWASNTYVALKVAVKRKKLKFYSHFQSLQGVSEGLTFEEQILGSITLNVKKNNDKI